MRTFLFRLIGILEIAGGLYGAAAMLRRLLPLGSTPLGSTQYTVFALSGLGLFVFIMAAGVLLLENSERGVMFSRAAQLLQLPLVATPLFSYALHSGAYLNIHATLAIPSRLGFDWNFGSQGYLLAVSGHGLSRMGINLAALLSWLVLRLR